MPRDVDPDVDSDVDSLDEETIKQLQLPEPEPIQIKISALHRKSRKLCLCEGISCHRSCVLTRSRGLRSWSDQFKSLLSTRCCLASEETVWLDKFYLQQLLHSASHLPVYKSSE